MQRNTSIAIIGATGNMGSAIARSLAGKFRLLLCAKDPGKLEALTNEISIKDPAADVEQLQCFKNASWEADIIIFATPFAAEKEIAETIREVANQKIVVSISNPLNDTFDGLVTNPGTSAAEELQKLLPHSKVVKAFNTTFAADFASPVINEKQVDCFVAGDEPVSVQTVEELVRTIGFNPLNAGSLAVSRTLESMQLLMIQLGLKYNYNWHAGWKILHN